MSNDIIARPSSEIGQLKTRFETKDLESWTEDLDTDRKPILKQALYVFILIFGVGGFWSATAPLGGSISASGRIVAADKNPIIQHLEGGILKEILVREGDKVKAGQILARLDNGQIDAELTATQLTREILRIELARYRAIVNEQEKVQFPTNLNPEVANHPRILEAIASQQEEFDAQRRIHLAELDILNTRIEGEKLRIEGTQKAFEGMKKQYALYTRELEDYKELLSQGLVRRSVVFATERNVVDVEVRMKNSELAIKDAQHNMTTFEAEKKQARLTVITKSNAQLVRIQKALSRLDGQVERVADRIRRSELRSPVNGTVFRMTTTSPGSVLVRGAGLMEIFPDDDQLEIEIQLPVTNIKKVYLDQKVDVIFPGNRQKALTPLAGKVTYISRDAIVNERNGAGAYIVRASLDPDQDFEDVVPGNMAEVYIQTKTTTFLEIMAGPITRFGLKVFNE